MDTMVPGTQASTATSDPGRRFFKAMNIKAG
jgi:hypothetical protein